MKMILESKPENVRDGITFAETFKDAKVKFTYILVKGGDRSVTVLRTRLLG